MIFTIDPLDFTNEPLKTSIKLYGPIKLFLIFDSKSSGLEIPAKFIIESIDLNFFFNSCLREINLILLFKSIL